MRHFLITLSVIIGIPLLVIGGFVLHGCNAVVGTAHKAIDVTAAQFDPATMLKRYEWFKNAAAALDAKSADIAVYESRLSSLEADYKGKPANEWQRDDRQQLSVWRAECAGVKASFNGLAAEYNAAMAKINYRFCNVGQLPQGATTPLPREYKPYITQ